MKGSKGERISPTTIKRILATVEQPGLVRVRVESPLRVREALANHFRRHHPDLQLHARTLPHGLICWATKRMVVA